MSVLRNQQIKDILEEDAKYRNLAFNRMRQNVSKFDAVAKPQSEDDSVKLLDVDATIQKLGSLLDEKLLAYATISEYIGLTTDFKKNTEYFQSLKVFFEFGSIVNLYNKIVFTYQKEQKNSVRELIKSKLMVLSDSVNKMSIYTNEIDSELSKSDSDKDIRSLSGQSLKAINVYDRLNAQLRDNEALSLIRPEDLKFSTQTRSSLNDAFNMVRLGRSGDEPDKDDEKKEFARPQSLVQKRRGRPLGSKSRPKDREDDTKLMPPPPSRVAKAQGTPAIEDNTEYKEDRPRPKKKLVLKKMEGQIPFDSENQNIYMTDLEGRTDEDG